MLGPIHRSYYQGCFMTPHRNIDIGLLTLHVQCGPNRLGMLYIAQLDWLSPPNHLALLENDRQNLSGNLYPATAKKLFR